MREGRHRLSMPWHSCLTGVWRSVGSPPPDKAVRGRPPYVLPVWRYVITNGRDDPHPCPSRTVIRRTSKNHLVGGPWNVRTHLEDLKSPWQSPGDETARCFSAEANDERSGQRKSQVATWTFRRRRRASNRKACGDGEPCRPVGFFGGAASRDSQGLTQSVSPKFYLLQTALLAQPSNQLIGAITIALFDPNPFGDRAAGVFPANLTKILGRRVFICFARGRLA